MKEAEPRPIRVLVADSHPLYRDGLVRAIEAHPELELAGQAGGGREALRGIRRLAPDVAVLDAGLPELGGVAIADALGGDSVRTRVIVLAGQPDGALAYDALAGGVKGCLSKEADGESICAAIAAVHEGETVLPAALHGGVAEEIRRRGTRNEVRLSEREREVLEGLARGLSSPQIAGQLHVSPGTVKTHLQHLYEKLGVSERAAAVAAAMRRGLLD